MRLTRPELRYTRDTDREDPLVQALRLMRDVEGLLETTHSLGGMLAAPTSNLSLSVTGTRHGEVSTRIARAMAASLVDELEAVIARRKSRSGAA